MTPFDKVLEAIHELPTLIEPDDPTGGVLRSWVRNLPLRHQGVIITAMRGCDVAHKEDHSKRLVAMLRRACLNPADARESLAIGGFFGYNPTTLANSLTEFLHSLDAYPLHYVAHLMHACEVVGYKDPEYEDAMARFFFSVYCCVVGKLHLRIETGWEMDERLCEDRVAKGTVERDY